MELFEVIIEGSGRHLHVTRETLDTLFGKGFELVPKKDLSQPGQYASEQKVDLAGPKGTIKGVTIVGPCRPYNQVELSMADARPLGIDPPIRLSGDLAGSAPVKLVGPAGEVDLTEGAIIAKRHLHVSAEDGEKYGIKDKDMVLLKVGGERGLTFDECQARVGTTHATYVHLDYDEVNAIAGVTKATVVKK
ncbi:MAG: phosphate propanoyltransferase [Oscillospiraceae bacterium]|jgi:putative phosphotransacetylase|nr:phosphate propanoyltransferase [Oscillospiraceae bacterium]